MNAAEVEAVPTVFGPFGDIAIGIATAVCEAIVAIFSLSPF